MFSHVIIGLLDIYFLYGNYSILINRGLSTRKILHVMQQFDLFLIVKYEFRVTVCTKRVLVDYTSNVQWALLAQWLGVCYGK